ncbi:cytochrome c oxidase assembly factor CtaG [Metabacillus sp. CT-WN-B3]|uniref:Cytochrome c oxidase assembly factor CtaG n=1 Tax=Metabacillus hrfriensis TaxID=3048891 RepID=A0ACD4RH87_9BACI|nr:cytochrome c oxidase assembly factor CtaG [Metabacillus sp. CT-WN-B3]WHZ59693.1 cytochrome c oxidase assembly factor CtaG [Metabacillus sp. CT-WN-B3]
MNSLLNLEIFGFRAMWSPYFFLFVAVILGVYFLLIGPLRNRFHDSQPVPFKQKALFAGSMILLYAVKGSPLDLMGHIMFSAHMTQMALLYLLIPPLMIYGIPVWMWRAIIYRRGVKQIVSFLSKPLIALIVFNGVFSIYHIPLVFDVVKTDHVIHASVTIFIFIAAMLMWWPLLNELPEWRELGGIKKIGYIFANGMLLTPACALIIFADTSLYSTYSDPSAWVSALELCVPASMLSGLNLTGPEMFNTLPLVEDQQLGGIMMKIIQEFVYGSLLGIIFFKWARQERESDDLEERKRFTPQPIK